MNDEWLAAFQFEPSPLGHGYASGGVTSARFIEMQQHGEKFLRDLRRKAEKRAKLPRSHARVSLLVAIANDEADLDPVIVLSALTGSRCTIRRPNAEGRGPRERPPPVFPARIEAARRTAWEPLLVEWDYTPSPSLLLTDFGAYLDDADPWARDLSGILVAHNVGRHLQWLPNPFAASEINEPRLLEMGLSYAKLGLAMEMHG